MKSLAVATASKSHAAVTRVFVGATPISQPVRGSITAMRLTVNEDDVGSNPTS